MMIKCETHYQQGGTEKRDAIAVCHHCGKPLCALLTIPFRATDVTGLKKSDICGYLIRDPVFATRVEGEYVEARHCESCLVEFHSEFNQELQKLKSRL
jgi:hypothetical protein